MKRFAALLFLFSVSTWPVVAGAATDRAASTDNPCLQKRADILKQIDQAKQHGNDRRVAGLNKALREQEANCSPEAIRKARAQDVAEARDKLAERERELQAARQEGREADKLAKRAAKVKEAQDELQRAQKALGN